MIRIQTVGLVGLLGGRASALHPAGVFQTVASVQKRAGSTHQVSVAPNRKIAYQQMPGTRQPTVVFVPGLHSYAHMNGMTAKSILR